jgi:hypothetical protein
MDILNETINPCELAKKKKDAYKDYVLDLLRKVIASIECEDWERLNNFCFDSPAGDGYGMDNRVVNFSPNKEKPIDIMGAAYIIEYYNRVARGIIDSENCLEAQDLIERACWNSWGFPTYENGEDLED